MSDERCGAEHPDHPEIRCITNKDHPEHYGWAGQPGRSDPIHWPNPDYVSPAERREQRERQERLEKERIRRMALLVRRDRRIGDEGPSRLDHLEGCAADHLTAYCSPRGPFAWWAFARSGDPRSLDAADILAVQLLETKIRPALVIQMFSDDGNPYAQLRLSIEALLKEPTLEGKTVTDVDLHRADDMLGQYLRTLDRTGATPHVTPVLVSQVLHRKRPELFPRMDAAIQSFYKLRANDPVDLVLTIRGDMNWSSDLLAVLTKDRTTPDGKPISQLAVLQCVILHHVSSGCRRS